MRAGDLQSRAPRISRFLAPESADVPPAIGAMRGAGKMPAHPGKALSGLKLTADQCELHTRPDR